MAYKGKFKPTNIEKYMGDYKKITYRSLWERRFMKFCDENDSILKWGSEIVIVPYKSPIDGKMHRYFVDFIIETINKNKNRETTLIEVKPKKHCIEPKKQVKRTRKYITEVQRFCINKAKWDSATEWAENRGWKFKILTEDHLLTDGTK